MQACPAVHPEPHVPQLKLVARRVDAARAARRHRPAVRQADAQGADLARRAPGWPQLPQLLSSTTMFAGRPPQSFTSPLAVNAVHAPFKQYCSAGHTLPGAPQLFSSALNESRSCRERRLRAGRAVGRAGLLDAGPPPGCTTRLHSPHCEKVLLLTQRIAAEHLIGAAGLAGTRRRGSSGSECRRGCTCRSWSGCWSGSRTRRRSSSGPAGRSSCTRRSQHASPLAQS